MNLRLSDRLREHLINGLSDGRWVGIFTYAFSENGPERIVAVLRAYEAVKEELESRQAYQSGDGFAYHVKLAVTTGFITPQAAHVVKGWSKRAIGVRNAAAHESRTVPWTESAAVAAFWHHVYSDLNRSTPHRSTSRMVQQLFELDEVLRQTDVGAGAVRSNSDMPRCFAVGSGVRGLSSIVLALRDGIDAKKTGRKPQSRIEIVADIRDEDDVDLQFTPIPRSAVSQGEPRLSPTRAPAETGLPELHDDSRGPATGGRPNRLAGMGGVGLAGAVVFGATGLWGVNAAIPWVWNPSPPSIGLAGFVTDDELSADAWANSAVSDADDSGLWAAQVRVECAGIQAGHWYASLSGMRVALADLVSAEELGRVLRAHPASKCQIEVAAWDRRVPWHAETRRLEVMAFADGKVLDEQSLAADTTAPVVRVSRGHLAVSDDGTGVATIEHLIGVEGQPSLKSWNTERFVDLERRRRTPLQPAPPIESMMPWTGEPRLYRHVVRVGDHAGNISASFERRYFRFQDSVVLADRVLGDVLPPSLILDDDLSKVAVVDGGAGIRQIAGSVACATTRGSVPLVTPPAFGTWVERLPVSEFLPPRLPTGQCSVTIDAEDHRHLRATLVLHVNVSPDGEVSVAPTVGDRLPPKLVGRVRDLKGAGTAYWVDEAPGIVRTGTAVVCEGEEPVLFPDQAYDGVGKAPALVGTLVLRPGRCLVSFSATDREGLGHAVDTALYVYPNGEDTQPAAVLDESTRPGFVGVKAATADGVLTRGEWDILRVVDPKDGRDASSGIYRVSVQVRCGKRVTEISSPVVRGVEYSAALSELVSYPVVDDRRCDVLLVAVDHAGNQAEFGVEKVRFSE